MRGITEVALVLGAASAFVTAVAVIVGFATQARRQNALDVHLRRVHDEVKTGNGQTLGMLADAIETRRAAAIPPGERTDAEQDHLDHLDAPRPHDA